MQWSQERVEVFDCPIDSTTMARAVERCVSWCGEDRSAPARSIITVNAAILVGMRTNAGLRRACLAGDMILPDGVPVVWASRLLRRPLRSRVAGVDLMENLLEESSRGGLRVFFLGAKEEVVLKLVEVCGKKYPGMTVAGYRNGYFKEAESGAVIEQIRSSRADLLFVGMPTPFKEVWCEEHREGFGVRVIMGVGGSFDVLAGFISRAPRWMQSAGLEWFWRFMMEPRKMWKRYLLTNTAFLKMLASAMVTPHRSVASASKQEHRA